MGTKTTELPKGEIIMEDIDSDLERSNDSALNYNYDVINLKESETNPFFPAIRDILEYHNRQHNDLNDSDEFDATKAIKSLQTLAIEVKIWMNMSEPQDAIFAIVSDLIVVLFKSKKTIVVMPFKIQEIRGLVLAENVPSACTIEVSQEIENKIGRSHLIFESKSMGLLMRYVLEREYDIEVDFCDSVPMRINGGDGDFYFGELEKIKKDKEKEESNGTVRCTVNGPLHVCEEGGIFSTDDW